MKKSHPEVGLMLTRVYKPRRLDNQRPVTGSRGVKIVSLWGEERR
jgi:hypothetical protein